MKKIFILLLLLLPLAAAAKNRIIISKKQLHLYVVNEANDTIFDCPVACGINYGNKTRAGDHKTPEGEFTIKMMYDASSWKYDFGDGQGMRVGAYGPYFFRIQRYWHTRYNIPRVYRHTQQPRMHKAKERRHNNALPPMPHWNESDNRARRDLRQHKYSRRSFCGYIVPRSGIEPESNL